MPTATKDRSQPLLRVPRDQTPVVITLDDGERSGAMLFVPPGDSITRVVAETTPFVPVNFASGTRLVARTAIACITIHIIHARPDDEPVTEHQRVTIRVRGGFIVKGELRWAAPEHRSRTLDYLNEPASHLVLHEGEYISYIAKTHIISVEES